MSITKKQTKNKSKFSEKDFLSLIKEKSELVKITKERDELNEQISFLTEKINQFPENSKKSFPIYYFTVKGDWSRFYKKLKGEEDPLCHPDIIIEFQKKPVTFLNSELISELQDDDGLVVGYEFFKKRGLKFPVDGYLYPIVSDEFEMRDYLENYIFNVDQSGHPMHGSKAWELGLTTMKPDFFRNITKTILDSAWFSDYNDDRLESGKLSVFTDKCLENIDNPESNFFSPRLTFKTK